MAKYMLNCVSKTHLLVTSGGKDEDNTVLVYE